MKSSAAYKSPCGTNLTPRFIHSPHATVSSGLVSRYQRLSGPGTESRSEDGNRGETSQGNQETSITVENRVVSARAACVIYVCECVCLNTSYTVRLQCAACDSVCSLL